MIYEQVYVVFPAAFIWWINLITISNSASSITSQIKENNFRCKNFISKYSNENMTPKHKIRGKKYIINFCIPYFTERFKNLIWKPLEFQTDLLIYLKVILPILTIHRILQTCLNWRHTVLFRNIVCILAIYKIWKNIILYSSHLNPSRFKTLKRDFD